MYNTVASGVLEHCSGGVVACLSAVVTPRDLGVAAGTLLFFSALVLVGIVALPKLRGERQGYPAEDQIEDLLLPYIYDAICAAFKQSEKAAQELGIVMDGADKKAIADYIYNLLPDVVGGLPVGVVKAIVTRERFSALVEEVYQRFKIFYDSETEELNVLFEKWKADYQALKPNTGAV